MNNYSFACSGVHADGPPGDWLAGLKIDHEQFEGMPKWSIALPRPLAVIFICHYSGKTEYTACRAARSPLISVVARNE